MENVKLAERHGERLTHLFFPCAKPNATEVGQETIKCLTLILFLHRYKGTRSDVSGRGAEFWNDDSLPTTIYNGILADLAAGR